MPFIMKVFFWDSIVFRFDAVEEQVAEWDTCNGIDARRKRIMLTLKKNNIFGVEEGGWLELEFGFGRFILIKIH